MTTTIQRSLFAQRGLLAALPLLCAMALAPWAPASAQPSAIPPDTLVLSDSLQYDDVRKETVFTGKVVLTRGNLTLHADRLAMREDADGNQFGVATVNNGVVYIRQETPEKHEILEARGLRGDYDGKSQTFTMTGQATLTRFICGKPFDNVQGERVIYRQANDTYEAIGGKGSSGGDGRVRSLTRPRAAADQAAAQCKARPQS